MPLAVACLWPSIAYGHRMSLAINCFWPSIASGHQLPLAISAPGQPASGYLSLPLRPRAATLRVIVAFLRRTSADEIKDIYLLMRLEYLAGFGQHSRPFKPGHLNVSVKRKGVLMSLVLVPPHFQSKRNTVKRILQTGSLLWRKNRQKTD